MYIIMASFEKTPNKVNLIVTLVCVCVFDLHIYFALRRAVRHRWSGVPPLLRVKIRGCKTVKSEKSKVARSKVAKIQK